jgi:hypothetical protein
MSGIPKGILELVFWIALVLLVLLFVWDFNRWEIEQATQPSPPPLDMWEEVKP